jgi:CRP-like cAMP-binding protein
MPTTDLPSPDAASRLTANQILAALPREEFDLLASQCEVVTLPTRTTIYEVDEAIRHVYFPLTGVVSVTTVMEDGAMVEVGTIGREGMTGLPVFNGAAHSPLFTFTQIPGDHARMPVPAFRAASAPGTALHRLLQGFAQAYYVLTAQGAGCNRLHPVEERCARWLLMTHDRVGADTFPLSHEFIGMMLGVRRASVSVAMATLQHAGLITYRRGVVTVLDRPSLEAAACECYAIIQRAFAPLPD